MGAEINRGPKYLDNALSLDNAPVNFGPKTCFRKLLAKPML